MLNFNDFTSHFDTTGHTYSNIILNNDVYTYTGVTGETHYFCIYDYYSGGTISINPALTGMTENDVITGFSTSIISCVDILAYSGNCCPKQVIKSNLPWVYLTNHGGGLDNCSDFIARRPNNGTTIDFVFNKNGLPWSSGGIFFYTGVRDEYDPANYGDNNLSFGFTSDGRIKWEAYRYSGYCKALSGYTAMYYVDSGQTMPLCTNGTSSDFNITINFDRYYKYSGWSVDNEGGYNDLIMDTSIVTGNTLVISQVEILNKKWNNERQKRLGVLKIYHNGRLVQWDVPSLFPNISNFRNLPVYKLKNWEEVILSDRGFQPFAQAVGGGVTGCEGIHEGVCCFKIKYAAYTEDTSNAIDIYDHYLNVIKPNFDITECYEECTDDLHNIILLITDAILTEDYNYYISTSDGFYYIKTIT